MQDLAAALSKRQQQQLYRRRQTLESPQDVEVQIEGQTYLSFCSNDYLGLANHPDVIEALKAGADRFGVGSGAAHLISGHSVAHQALEEELADFVGRPRALLFSTGYMANLGVISALAGRGDGVFEDRLNHASLIDAAALSGAQLKRYKHADSHALQGKLEGAEVRQCLIATDSVFSMDGDCAPLKQLQALAVMHDSWLLTDDAHGFGMLGPQGRGFCVDQLGAGADNLILMATLGKALGTGGAFVAGSVELIETLIQQARTYVYTTATSPALAWATRTALQLVRQGDDLRQHLNDNISYFRQAARQLNLPLMESICAIQPLRVGDASMAVRLSESLRDEGILVTAIRPPTVPKGTARLRITLCAKHSRQQLDRLLDVLQRIFQEPTHAAG
ncbi:8-amino-7-oxononanoate synthase [hydrothermal vent metagenome]|uniref:8-amino-7-oxononanoate synthase n=1 Tax=hydrothermal vent metagenome TaxID=652676 RepID=A0A3B0YI19_9ZZZZ